MLKQSLPLSLYSCAETRKLDDLAIQNEGIPGIVLMKRAGQFAFSTLLNTWPDAQHVLVLCGAGNNAGDGYVLAALAAQRALSVSVLAVVDPGKLQHDALRAAEYAQQEGVKIEMFSEAAFLDACQLNTVVVDALLGSGINRLVEGCFASAIACINSCHLPVLALDIPSGLDGDSGKEWGVAVKATATTTFIGVKRGLLTGRAPALVGSLSYSDLQVPAS